MNVRIHVPRVLGPPHLRVLLFGAVNYFAAMGVGLAFGHRFGAALAASFGVLFSVVWWALRRNWTFTSAKDPWQPKQQ